MALAKTLVLAMGTGMLAFLIADEYMLFDPAIWAWPIGTIACLAICGLITASTGKHEV